MIESLQPVATKQSTTVLDRFLQVVDLHPTHEAIVFESRVLTYRQLDELANQFAHLLSSNGVGFGDRVGLCMQRCPEAIAVMLATFKLGAAFVPLDPEYPLDRLAYMVEDAAIGLIVTDDVAANPLAKELQTNSELTWVDTEQAVAHEPSSGAELCGTSASDLAYIMYTSGSTGRPKGVEIEHLALQTYCDADIEVYKLTSSDRTLQFSTLNFDIAIEEIFPPLAVGSCVVVRPRDRSSQANELSEIVNRHAVTAVHLATAYWHEWVDLMIAAGEVVPNSLRLVIATGEKVSVEHYRRWKQICRNEVLWCNAYGPTETTVTATVFIPSVNFNAEHMPIGKPLPGYTAFILDDEQRPIHDGTTGHLFIGGSALAKGYLNREDLTQRAFIHVDVSQHDVAEGDIRRLYRTGDLARWLPTGDIEFAGRVDHQIKLGSYRIEPGEIEAVANRLDRVLDSLVVVDESSGPKTLVAYMATGDHRVTVEEIDKYLRCDLPAYMVPTKYVLLESLPKTINGKIDRKALPAADTAKTPRARAIAPPRDVLETKLVEVWKQVLNQPAVGIDDDFFTLGGSSLLVTRVVAELKLHFGILLPVRDFFAHPTIASSARQLRNLLRVEARNCDSFCDPDSASVSAASNPGQPTAEAEYIHASDRELFSVLYRPMGDVNSTADRQTGVLICHPLGHEYQRSYKNLQQLALLIAQAGFPVMRFDYSGTGNSSGLCADLRSESLETDARHAATYLRKTAGVDRLCLIGLRLGATIAARVQPAVQAEKLILWDPIFEGRDYVTNLQAFHQHAIGSQTRFARKLTQSSSSDHDGPQLYGQTMPAEKAASLSQLKLPEEVHQCVIVSSGMNGGGRHDPEDPLRTLLLRDSNKHLQTTDEIYWEDPLYAESAFASPAAFEAIVAEIENIMAPAGVSE